MLAHAVAPNLTAADAFLPAYEQFEAMVAQLRAPQVQRMTHSAVEELLETEGRELLRRLLQAHFDERSPGQGAAPVRDTTGQLHTHQRLHTRALVSVFGEVSLTRQGYGGRGLTSLHPLDAALNLPPERYSHTVRRRVAEEAAKASFDEVVATLAQHPEAAVPKRQAEALVPRAAQDFDAFYEAQRQASAAEVQATSEVLVISSDGKGVPLLKADLRPATQVAAETRQGRLAHRHSKGEKAHTKRMSTVAAVYTIAPHVRTPEQSVRELQPEGAAPEPRPRPEDKRVWASLTHSPQEVIQHAQRDLARFEGAAAHAAGQMRQLPTQVRRISAL